MNTPQLPPLVVQSNGKYSYLCSFTNKWDKDKKRSYRANSVTVGKIVGGGKEGLIQWTDTFIEQHPELEELDATRKLVLKNNKKVYEIVFTQSSPLDDITVTLRDSIKLKKLNGGATWLLDGIFADTPLAKALHESFNTYNLDKKLLSLAYFKIIEPEQGIYLYEDFANRTRLPFHRALSSSQITRLLQRVDADSIDRFLKKLNQECTLQEEKNVGNTNVYYALDSTSISTCSANLQEGEWGHNKDFDNLKQFNLLMLVNQDTGCPIYYREYPGSTPDVSTVIHLLKECARLGVNQKAILVADRGYGSILNINKLLQNNQSFIFNLRTGFTFVKQELASVLNTLLDECNFDRKIGVSHVTLKRDWRYPPLGFSTLKKGAGNETVKLYIHIYLNHDIREQALEEFRNTVSGLIEKLNEYNKKQQALEEAKKQKQLDDKAYTTKEIERLESDLLFYTLTQEEKDWLDKFTCFNTNNIRVVNNVAKAQYLITKGIRVLVSDIVSDPIEAHRAYIDRNEVEEGFRKFKDFTGGRRMHVSNYKTFKGKLFIHFLATSLLCMLRHRIHNAERRGIELPSSFDSIPKIIAALSNITQTVFNDGAYFSEVVGKKKDLFKALDISLPEDEMGVSYEEDDKVGVDDEDYTNVEDLPV